MVFDEPTAGLHPADAARIGRLLCRLRDKHNNVLVVEHSRQMFELADHIIELGEHAGAGGGKIVFEGSLSELMKAGTQTAESLRKKITVNKNPLAWTDSYEIRNASQNPPSAGTQIFYHLQDR